MKVKIAKRVVLLCVALTIAVVVTFGRRDGQPQIDGKSSESGAENLALRLADGSDKPKSDESGLPPLADIPVFGPTDDSNEPANDALAALPGLPSLDDFTSPDTSSESAPDASTSPLPDVLDALPSLDPPVSDSTAPAEDTSLPALGLPSLTDISPNAPTDSNPTTSGQLPSLAPLSINEPAETPGSDPPLDALSGSLDNDKDVAADNRPVEPFPPPFTPAPVAAPTLPSEPRAQIKSNPVDEPAATVAQLPPPMNSNASISPVAPTPLQPTPTLTPMTPTHDSGPPPARLSANSQTPPVQSTRERAAPTLLKPAPPVAAMPARTRPRQPIDQRGVRRHRVTDNDTLESISQRYFGSAAYANEIYQANRLVLNRSDVLLLNTQLTIPNLAASGPSQTRPAARPAPQSVRQPAIDPFNALPSELPASRPAPPLAPNANNTQAIPETRRPVNPLPAIIEDGSNQNRQPKTRLVPVPSA